MTWQMYGNEKKEEGIVDEKKNTVERMLKGGCSIEMVCLATALSEQEVRKIESELFHSI